MSGNCAEYVKRTANKKPSDLSLGLIVIYVFDPNDADFGRPFYGLLNSNPPGTQR